MKDAETNDVLDDLRAELAAVRPSAGFAAGVRARIADAPAGGRWSWLWWSLPAALACGAGAAPTGRTTGFD